MDFEKVSEENVELINRELDDALEELKGIQVPGKERKLSLYEPAKHVLDGGKRLRPLLSMFSCEAVGGNPKKVLSAAAGVELIHTFTLVHDDIMDKGEMRRGKPAVHRIWGDAVAILTGDALYTLGIKKIISSIDQNGVEGNQLKRILNRMAEVCLKLADGQMMDLTLPTFSSGSSEDWGDEVIKLKTAELFGFSAELGAILGGGSDSEIECMKQYGEKLGMAFQIRDDILDLTVDELKAGKTTLRDIANGKQTLPLIHLKKSMNGTFSKTSEKDLAKKPKSLAELLKHYGSLEFADGIARKVAKEAKLNLLTIKEWYARSFLIHLADYAIGGD